MRFGRWPRLGCWVVKVRAPPSWRSSRTPGNFHTVTFLFAHESDPAINPLMMGEGLEQLLCWHCTCQAGLRTNSSCTHRNGILILLCATQCWDTAKVQECLYVDTARSDSYRFFPIVATFSFQARRSPASGVWATLQLPRRKPGRALQGAPAAPALHP